MGIERHATAGVGLPGAVDPSMWPRDEGLTAEVDAAGMQCLLALARSLNARQQRLRLDHPSQALRLACLRLGAQHLLAEPEGAAA